MLRGFLKVGAIGMALVIWAGAAILTQCASADDKPSTKFDPAWVEKRVQEWQPTKDERRFDEIGWAKDIREAKRLSKDNHRPMFLFTLKGHAETGRC